MNMSGFTGYQVIQSLKRAYPNIANQLTQLQVMGYTANQIAGALGRGKGKNVPTEEMYDTQTEHEKAEEAQSRNKTKAMRQALGIGATALLGGGLTLSAFRGLKNASPAMTLLTGRGATQAAQAAPTTINQFQKGLPFNPGQMGGRNPPSQLPNIPPPAPSFRGKPTLGGPTAPLGLPHIAPEYAQSVHIVNSSGEGPRLKLAIKQGLDFPTTVSLMQTLLKADKKAAGRGALDLFQKAPGGLEKIIFDYANFMKQEEQQQASMQQEAPPQEQPDERIQFQEPPQSIAMQGPEQQAPIPQEPHPVEQAFNEAPQQGQIQPGRQRLMGLMSQLREARGGGNAPQMQQAPAPMQQPVQAAPLPKAPIISPKPFSVKKEKNPKKPAYESLKNKIVEKLEKDRFRLKEIENKLNKTPKSYVAKKAKIDIEKEISNSEKILSALEKKELKTNYKEKTIRKSDPNILKVLKHKYNDSLEHLRREEFMLSPSYPLKNTKRRIKATLESIDRFKEYLNKTQKEINDLGFDE